MRKRLLFSSRTSLRSCLLLVLLSKSLSSSWCLVAHPLLEAHLLKPIAPIWTQSIRAYLFSNQELVQAGLQKERWKKCLIFSLRSESLLVERLLPFQSHIDSWTILITYLFSGKDSIKSIRTLVLLPVFSIIVHSCLYLSVEITILAFPLRCLHLSATQRSGEGRWMEIGPVPSTNQALRLSLDLICPLISPKCSRVCLTAWPIYTIDHLPFASSEFPQRDHRFVWSTLSGVPILTWLRLAILTQPVSPASCLREGSLRIPTTLQFSYMLPEFRWVLFLHLVLLIRSQLSRSSLIKSNTQAFAHLIKRGASPLSLAPSHLKQVHFHRGVPLNYLQSTTTSLSAHFWLIMNLQAASQDPNWMQAIKEELHALQKNHTFNMFKYYNMFNKP